jgi:ribonucleoside-diphosphate reductase alpha chain
MQRLADDIVDLELEAIDRIISKIKSDPEPQEVKQIGLDLWQNIKATAIRDRRTGCGFTALGDCLAALNIKYASDDSIYVTENIQKTFKIASYESSIDMAEELGSFPNYNWENDIKSTFIQRMNEEYPLLCNRMKQCGRRNMVLLTIAPTGSVSCMTQTTSGLEPVFMLEYKRRKKVNPHDKNVTVDFVDQSGDSWTEFVVRHKGLQEYIDITGKTLEDSPYFGATANEIDWVAKTRLQGVLQKHIDNSISVTTNLPNNITYDEVDKIYLNAWKEGCKGCTVYRDGCRTGVLVANEPKSSDIKDRPKTLKCDVHHITSKGHSYFVLIGFLDNKPYEVFAGKNGFLDKDIKTGTITRKSKKVYKAVFDDEDKTELCPITSTCSDHEETITRLTSALLRSDADLELIVEQLEKVHGDITIFAKCIARVLKKYLKDGTVSGQTCTECGSSNIVRQEGCLTCKECGYGKCG